MVRHYESLGLLGGVPRTDSGYRLYGAADVHRCASDAAASWAFR
jgi:DNA-binding transcriptional MerR regulator